MALTGAGAGAAVVWDDVVTGTVGRDILLSLNGGPTRVNTTLTGDQAQAAICALPGAGFVVVWCDLGTAGGRDIRGRVYDATGNPVSSTDFLVTDPGAPSAGSQFNFGFLRPQPDLTQGRFSRSRPSPR